MPLMAFCYNPLRQNDLTNRTTVYATDYKTLPRWRPCRPAGAGSRTPGQKITHSASHRGEKRRDSKKCS